MNNEKAISGQGNDPEARPAEALTETTEVDGAPTVTANPLEVLQEEQRVRRLIAQRNRVNKPKTEAIKRVAGWRKPRAKVRRHAV